MNFPARVGVALIAGLLACGAIPAAHAATATTTHAHELSSSAAIQAVAPSPPGDPESSSLEMPCTPSVKSSRLHIAFSSEVPFDELTVSVNEQSAPPLEVQSNSVVLERPDSGSTVRVELWEEESLTRECVETVPSESAEPSPTEVDESPTSPTPSPSASDPATPSPSPSSRPPKPSTTPSRTSTPLRPAPTAPGSSSSSPSRATSNPPMSKEPTVLPPDTTERTAQRPPSTMHHQPEPMGPRIIRQFSNDPRDLLPQLLGITGQSGSELIMPRPRSANQEPPALETLPPVSEDELDAIKARLSSPNRADRPAGDHLAAADERVADWRSNALLPSLIAAACFGTAIFWWRKRRRHKL